MFSGMLSISGQELGAFSVTARTTPVAADDGASIRRLIKPHLAASMMTLGFRGCFRRSLRRYFMSCGELRATGRARAAAADDTHLYAFFIFRLMRCIATRRHCRLAGHFID